MFMYGPCLGVRTYVRMSACVYVCVGICVYGCMGVCGYG